MQQNNKHLRKSNVYDNLIVSNSGKTSFDLSVNGVICCLMRKDQDGITSHKL